MTGRPADRVDRALDEIRAGGVVLLCGPGAEPGGRLVLAAELASTESVALIVRRSAGLLRVAMSAEDLDRLRLQLMSPGLADTGPAGVWARERTAVSVDARSGISTGISAHDRALTARLLGTPATTAGQLTRPGHVIPVCVADGGVLVRADRSEAAVDLVAMAGLHPAAVFDDIVNERGELDDDDHVARVARDLGLLTLRVEEVVARRRSTEQSVDLTAVLEVSAGLATVRPFVVQGSGSASHLVLIAGDPAAPGAMVGVHRECLAGMLGDPSCGCRSAFLHDFAAVGRNGDGVLIVLRQQAGESTPTHTARLPLRAVDDEAAEAVLQRLGLTSGLTPVPSLRR